MPRRRVRKGRTLAFGGGGVCSVVEEHERAYSCGERMVWGRLCLLMLFSMPDLFSFLKTLKLIPGLGQTPSSVSCLWENIPSACF